jgi:SAM-dependent methyltransferase
MDADYGRFPKPGAYTTRTERQAFLIAQFGPLLAGSVLDVGCDRKELKGLLAPGTRYMGIDVSEEADLTINLDQGALPFADGSFKAIVCLDVLEHLDRIHFVLDELLRVAASYIIISLPNAWFSNKRMFFTDRSSKFYGLSPAPPPDRHRWFFNISEAANFLWAKTEGKARRVTLYPYFNPTNRLAKAVLRRLLPRPRYLNLFCPTIWAVIEK